MKPLLRLLGAQTPEGSWPAAWGGAATTEATSLALLALATQPGKSSDAAITRGLAALASWRRPDGAFGAFPGDPDPSWATSFACLALGAYEAPGHKPAAAWLVSRQAPKQRFDAASRQRIRALLKIDPAIPGWAWFSETSPWVEPTAAAALALRAVPAPGSPLRILDAQRFLRDRELPGGGWNYGNPSVLGKAQTATPIPTSKALLALSGTSPAPAKGLAQLEEMLQDNPSPYAQGWGSLAFIAWDRPGLAATSAAAASKLTKTSSGGPGGLALAMLAAAVVAGVPSPLVPKAPPDAPPLPRKVPVPDGR